MESTKSCDILTREAIFAPNEPTVEIDWTNMPSSFKGVG